MANTLERLYYEDIGTSESLADLVKDMDRLYREKCKERETGESSHLINSLCKPSNAYKASRRTCELAVPKWHFSAIPNTKSINFPKRFGKNFLAKLSSKNREPPKKLVLRQIESGRPTANDTKKFKKTTAGEPKLIVFPPLPIKVKQPCPKRIAELAEPRHNLMEVRKKELEEQEKVYSVSEATLKAVPSDRIISLARHRDREYSEAKKRVVKNKEKKQNQRGNKKVRNVPLDEDINKTGNASKDAIKSKSSVELPPLNAKLSTSDSVTNKHHFKLLQNEEDDTLIAVNCTTSEEDLEQLS